MVTSRISPVPVAETLTMPPPELPSTRVAASSCSVFLACSILVGACLMMLPMLPRFPIPPNGLGTVVSFISRQSSVVRRWIHNLPLEPGDHLMQQRLALQGIGCRGRSAGSRGRPGCRRAGGRRPSSRRLCLGGPGARPRSFRSPRLAQDLAAHPQWLAEHRFERRRQAPLIIPPLPEIAMAAVPESQHQDAPIAAQRLCLGQERVSLVRPPPLQLLSHHIPPLAHLVQANAGSGEWGVGSG